MIGTKFYKDNYDQEKYTECAEWCNEHNATIIDQGEYYECVAIAGPTLEELKIAKLSEAGAAFAAKRDAVRWVEVSAGIYGFDTASEDITNFMAAKDTLRDIIDDTGNAAATTFYKVWLEAGTDKKGGIYMNISDFKTVQAAVRKSQIEAYAWYEASKAQIEAAEAVEDLAGL